MKRKKSRGNDFTRTTGKKLGNNYWNEAVPRVIELFEFLNWLSQFNVSFVEQ